MDQLLSLEDASLATGQPVSRLRTWCATGKLRCERQEHGWAIPLIEIPRVYELVAEHDRALSEGRAVAVVVPITNAMPDLPNEIARRLGLAERSVTTSTLALDGAEYVLAVWKTDGLARVALEPVAELVEQLGGEVLDGEARTQISG